MPEIDRDGYDVLLDDGEQIVPLQLKTYLSSATTKRWVVNKGLLRPLYLNCQSLGFEFSPEGNGIEGGLVVVKIIANADEIRSFEWFYSDCYILTAFESGLVTHKPNPHLDHITSFMSRLRTGYQKEKLEITKLCMVKVKSIDDLLALAGMPSKKQQQWRLSFKNSYHSLRMGTISHEERSELTDILQSHIDDPRLTVG
ncbi:hypothetical protein [Chryseolinea soli]|nr:hypothetical protein [Chryseolinea soli]